MARLKARYNDELKAKLKEELGIKNVMEIPRITKITLNMGVGAAATDKKLLDGAVVDMQLIAGQKPVITLARKSIAGFKIRDGWPIGCKVTLRGDQMYEFLDRLISIAIPRIRDFRGFSSKSFDGRGNYSMGLKEQIVFLKSISIRLIVFVVWILPLLRLLAPMTKAVRLCVHSASRSNKRSIWLRKV